GDRRSQGLALGHIGVCQARMGDLAKALDTFGRSVDLLRAAGDRRMEAMTLGSMANAYSDSGQPVKALDYGQNALAIFRAIGDRNHEARTLLTVATAQRQLGNLAEARRYAEESLARIEEVRADAGGEQMRSSYFASSQDAYEFTIGLLMEMHRQSP